MGISCCYSLASGGKPEWICFRARGTLLFSRYAPVVCTTFFWEGKTLSISLFMFIYLFIVRTKYAFEGLELECL